MEDRLILDRVAGAGTRREAPNSASLMLLLVWLLGTMSLWFFAFYSLPAAVPEWIRRAQIACFGSDASGLPGPTGWMLLVLSPLLLLSALCISLGEEIRNGLIDALHKRLGQISMFALGLIVIVQGVWVANSIDERISLSQGSELSGNPALLPVGYPRGNEFAADFSLIDQHGNQFTLSSRAGKTVIISFVFAHCQSVCPALVTTVNSALASMNDSKVEAILITLDPWRDTPAALPGMAERWRLHPGVSLLSGEPEDVNRVLDAYKVPRERDDKNGDVVHPAIVHLIGPDRKLTYSFNNPSPSWLKQAVERVSG